MKYVLLTIVVLLLCFLIGWIPAGFIHKKRHIKKGTTIALAFAFGILLAVLVSLGYLCTYYPADTAVTSTAVRIEELKNGYFFDGPGEEAALVFYPGAKVDTMAYAPLMIHLSEGGVDCYLADMPFHMAMLGKNAADEFLDNYSYRHLAAAGHSLGGVVISQYVSEHADRFDTLVLLASFPGNEISDDIRLCSIYGSEDGCLGLASYENAKSLWPEDSAEYIIEGANHAQYANYGPQSGDKEAYITREEQQKRTAEIILKIIYAP